MFGTPTRIFVSWHLNIDDAILTYHGSSLIRAVLASPARVSHDLLFPRA
jgi:hypothetical protein